jgi:hypothetical protein
LVGDPVLRYSRDEVEHHPTDKHELSLEKENDGLQTIDCCQHNNGDKREWRILCGDSDDEVDKLVARMLEWNRREGQRTNIDCSSGEDLEL